MCDEELRERAASFKLCIFNNNMTSETTTILHTKTKCGGGHLNHHHHKNDASRANGCSKRRHLSENDTINSSSGSNRDIVSSSSSSGVPSRAPSDISIQIPKQKGMGDMDPMCVVEMPLNMKTEEFADEADARQRPRNQNMSSSSSSPNNNNANSRLPLNHYKQLILQNQQNRLQQQDDSSAAAFSSSSSPAPSSATTMLSNISDTPNSAKSFHHHLNSDMTPSSALSQNSSFAAMTPVTEALREAKLDGTPTTRGAAKMDLEERNQMRQFFMTKSHDEKQQQEFMEEQQERDSRRQHDISANDESHNWNDYNDDEDADPNAAQAYWKLNDSTDYVRNESEDLTPSSFLGTSSSNTGSHNASGSGLTPNSVLLGSGSTDLSSQRYHHGREGSIGGSLEDAEYSADGPKAYSYHMGRNYLSLIHSTRRVLSMYKLPASVHQPLRRILFMNLSEQHPEHLHYEGRTDRAQSFSSSPISSHHSQSTTSANTQGSNSLRDEEGLRLPPTDSDARIKIHSLLDSSNIMGIIFQLSDKVDELFLYDLFSRRVLKRKSFSNVEGLYLHEDFILLQFKHFFEVYDNRLTVIFRNKMNPHCTIDLYSKIVAYPYLNQLMWIKNFSANRKDLLQAHKNEVTNCAVDQKHQYIASASSQGTLINVHNLNTKEKVRSFRRGQFQAQIHSIAFSCTSKYLAASSGSGTLHIWHMVEDAKNSSSMLKHLSYLGIDKFNSEWASLTVKDLAVPNSCRFDSQTENLIHIYAHEAKIYYLIEIVKNGNEEEAKIRNELTL